MTRPRGLLFPVDEVLDTLAEVGIDRSDMVGASSGAGVGVEVALTRPEVVASQLLSAAGGSSAARALNLRRQSENVGLAVLVGSGRHEWVLAVIATLMDRTDLAGNWVDRGRPRRKNCSVSSRGEI